MPIQWRRSRKKAGGGLITQQEALDQMSQLLQERLPRGATSMMLRVVGMTTSYSEFETIHILPDGSGLTVPGAEEPLATAAVMVRQAMYHGPGGTWFGAVFHYFDTGRMSAEFNYDEEPQWMNKPDVKAYVKDLATFQRAPEAIPPWLEAITKS